MSNILTSNGESLFDQLKNKINNQEIYDLQVEQYIPHTQKKILCEDILSCSIEINENDMRYVDYASFDLYKDIFIIKYYVPSLKLSVDDIFEQYDFLKKNKVIKNIYNRMDSDELTSINEIIKCSIEQYINSYNSVEAVLANGINKLLNKLPDADSKTIENWIGKLAKSVKGFDPNKYESLLSLMNFSKGSKE